MRPTDGLTAQVERLRRRSAFPIEGDAALRGDIEGLYSDGWTNGRFTVTVECARRVTGFTVIVVVPDWWPAGSFMNIEVDGIPCEPIEAHPGRYELCCGVEICAGRPTTIRLYTSETVFQESLQRRLGVYIGLIRFEHGDAAPFDCNVCGARNAGLEEGVNPEGSLCRGCQSNMRQRAVAYLIGDALWGRKLAMGQFQPATAVVGVGVSDSPLFAAHVANRIPNYMNGQFDAALVGTGSPFLDITNPSEKFLNTADFVTCSEVLEHVQSPVQKAFDGLYAILRPGGTLILTVPHTLETTIEHFPELYEWRLEEREDARVLFNRTADGTLQEFTDVRFHGGGEDVLEMRVFGLEDILERLKAAGFTEIRVRDENVLDYGIFFRYPWGLPITAKRPSESASRMA